MKTTLFPKTRLGTWATRLTTFTLLVFIFLYIFAELLTIITVEILITIFGTLAIITSLTALFLGIISVTKNKERSIFVYLAIFIGMFILAFFLGDLLGLHKG